jgi:hypothetical protein
VRTIRVNGTAADAMALLYNAASGLMAWSPDAVDVRSIAERRAPGMEWSRTLHHRTPARGAPIDTVVVRPAGAVLDRWNRTGPTHGVPSRCAWVALGLPQCSA